MDPVSVGLLVALAGGAGGELGREAWAGLSALVRRPFRRGGSDGDGDQSAISTGEAELTRLAQDPTDEITAQTLSTTLSVRAALDPDFCTALTTWLGQAQQIRIEDHTVHNTISGGTQHGPVLQGGTFTNLTFTQAPPRGGASEEGESPSAPGR